MRASLAHVPSKLRKKIEWLFRRAEGALLPDAIRAAEGAHLDPEGARLALRAAEDEVAIAGESARLAELLAGDEGYVARHGLCGVKRFAAGAETRIYQLSVETFPRHVNNVYLVLERGSSLLLDAGSGLPTSRRDLALGFAIVRDVLGEDVRWEDLDLCVVSHAHSDHCGGVNEVKKTSRAKLDARVIACFEERFVLATKDLEVYWKRAGVPPEQRAAMRELYAYGKRLFHSEPVDRVLQDGDVIGPGYRVHHVPGHCPGLVCLQVHDVLLTSDHVLARITPHQFPQAIAPFAGLEHYFRSLAKVRALDGIRLALGGHEEPILDLRTRIDEIARALFGEQEGYGVILAIDEAGAHVEYLHALGRLRVDNLDEVASSNEPVMRYVKR